MKNVKNEDCLKFEKLLLSYFRDILHHEEIKFMENHLKYCERCQYKYNAFKKIYDNFRMIENKNEIESAKSKKLTINEYKKINENLSAYIDKELCMKENLEIKRILIKNKYARRTFFEISKLINIVETDFEKYSQKINFRENIRNMYFCVNKLRIKS